MNAFPILLAPLALLAPMLGSENALPRAELLPEAGAPIPSAADRVETLDALDEPVAGQVRIEQRVIVRIAPPGPAQRQTLMPVMPTPAAPPKMAERKMGKCVAVGGIAAVQPDAAGRLLLLMRDRRLVSASLGKQCSARDFYSGFYLERTSDGMLCVERDKLHSRSGATCEIKRMRQLVLKDD
jgi:hypothetical protein